MLRFIFSRFRQKRNWKREERPSFLKVTLNLQQPTYHLTEILPLIFLDPR